MKPKFILLFTGMVLILALSACTPALSMLNAPAPAAASAAGVPQNAPQPQAGSLDNRSLTVTGVGRVTLTPDVANVNIGVHTENQNVTNAVEANNDDVSKVRDALIKFGIDAKDIQTSNFSIYTLSNYDASGNPTNNRYAVDNTLTVTVRDVSKIGQLLGEVTRNGANNISGITFDVADREEGLTQARELALENAEAQAKEMAGNLSVKLGQVISVVVNTDNYQVPMPYGLGGGGASDNVANVPISAGQLLVQVSVQVVYQIQ